MVNQWFRLHAPEHTPEHTHTHTHQHAHTHTSTHTHPSTHTNFSRTHQAFLHCFQLIHTTEDGQNSALFPLCTTQVPQFPTADVYRKTLEQFLNNDTITVMLTCGKWHHYVASKLGFEGHFDHNDAWRKGPFMPKQRLLENQLKLFDTTGTGRRCKQSL